MNLEEIKKELPEEAIPLLDEFLDKYPDNDEAYLVRGLKYWALGKRALAINDYHRALAINPTGRARSALESANAILDFYNTDLLNP